MELALVLFFLFLAAAMLALHRRTQRYGEVRERKDNLRPRAKLSCLSECRGYKRNIVRDSRKDLTARREGLPRKTRFGWALVVTMLATVNVA